MNCFNYQVTGAKIAILSYESSVGRTLITRELVRYAASQEVLRILAVCFDFEKPDLLKMLDQGVSISEDIFAPQPVIDIRKCSYCGECSGYCPYSAIQFNRYVPSVTLIVSRCTACGNCLKACSRNGIQIHDKLSGVIIKGEVDGYQVIGGKCGSSEFQIPLINALADRLDPGSVSICDFPPGNDSQVNIGISKMDVAVILVQPAVNWEEYLGLMLQMATKQGIPASVILNKAMNDPALTFQVQTYCKRNHISFLGIIPFEKEYKHFQGKDTPLVQGRSAKEFERIWKGIIYMWQDTMKKK